MVPSEEIPVRVEIHDTKYNLVVHEFGSLVNDEDFIQKGLITSCSLKAGMYEIWVSSLPYPEIK